MSKKRNKESKFYKYMKMPVRILAKARDFYMQTMNHYNDQLGIGGTVMGCPTAQLNALPRSFSSSSAKSSTSDQDLRELIRVASTRSLSNKVELDLKKQQQVVKQSSSNMPRSQSVGIGRIDEDKPYEFEDDFKVKTDVFPRSRSYAISKRKGVF